MTGFGPMLRDYLEYYKITQTDFADKLNITKKHLNNIINGKVGISEELMIAISLVTDIDINLIVFAENKKRMNDYLNKRFKNSNQIKQFFSGYHLSDMKKNGWIKLKDETSNAQNALDLLEYLNISSFDIVDNYLDKKILYKKSEDADLKKIYLWIKHCDSLIIGKEINSYNSSNFDNLLEELKNERVKKFNKKNIEKILNKYGIYLVIEDALKGTKIRGCMMVKGDNPAIYLTTTFKEKASFYFALYHELGHIKTDYNKAKNKVLIDDVESETYAGMFALDNMIPKNVYQELKDNIDDLEAICKSEKIPCSFVTTRFAKEGIIKYTSSLYNKYREKID